MYELKFKERTIINFRKQYIYIYIYTHTYICDGLKILWKRCELWEKSLELKKKLIFLNMISSVLLYIDHVQLFFHFVCKNLLL